MEEEKGDRLLSVSDAARIVRRNRRIAEIMIRNGQRKRHRESRHVWAGRGSTATRGLYNIASRILKASLEDDEVLYHKIGGGEDDAFHLRQKFLNARVFPVRDWTLEET